MLLPFIPVSQLLSRKHELNGEKWMRKRCEGVLRFDASNLSELFSSSFYFLTGND